MISRKDIEDSLGASVNNLKYYNSKKWALMRSPIFKSLPAADINPFITGFTQLFVKDRTAIDPEAYPGFIICL